MKRTQYEKFEIKPETIAEDSAKCSETFFATRFLNDPKKLVSKIKRALSRSDKPVGVKWFVATLHNRSLFVVSEEFLREYLTLIAPFHTRIINIALFDMALYNKVKSIISEMPEYQVKIEEEKKEMNKLIKEIAVNEIFETDAGTGFKHSDEDMTIEIIDHTYEIENPVLVKIFDLGEKK